jgi:hypothetical protein
MSCYSTIVPGVYVLLLTDCTWSLCFFYSQIVPGVYALLLRLYLEFMLCYSDCTGTIG